MKYLHIGAAALLALVAFATPSTATDPHKLLHHRNHRILTFATMYGVEGPFTGATNAIRNLPGDDLPWVANSAKGYVNSDGQLKVFIRGLVFSDDPSVPVELQGKNDEHQFRAVLSCMSEDEQGNVITANVMTEGFEADEAGNCVIKAQLVLPDPCIAPMVFIVSGSEDKWFAVNGFESEDD